MGKRLCISAFGSNSGKTLLTTALLFHLRGRVRGFKVGPDFIDPQFHKRVSGIDSINLDSFMMNEPQLKWIFSKYDTEEFAIIEGVMGFYDGEDRGCSTNLVTNYLNTPTILVIDCSGSYITISALLKGVLEYRENQIKGVVLNRVSSKSHFELIRDILQKEHPQIEVLGWIKKDLPSLNSIHLGLDLKDLSKIEALSKEALENIDIDRLLRVATSSKIEPPKEYPFPDFKKIDKKVAIVNDENFSFLYYDNLIFLKEMFDEVELISSTKNQKIPKDTDLVYIPGGYVESSEAYERIKNSSDFRESLRSHSKRGAVYAECAGLLYLGKRVDDKRMSGILDIEFKLQKRFKRLGYYTSENRIKGHCFHYTAPTKESLKKGFNRLFKKNPKTGEVGSWREQKVVGTYLHTFFRAYPQILKELL